MRSKKGLTKAKITGKAVRFLFSDGGEDTIVTIKIGSARLNEVDVEKLNRLVEFVKENPASTCDFSKPHRERWSDSKHPLHLANDEVMVE